MIFEKVIPTELQVEELYEVLSSRKYNISHNKMPDYDEHKKFSLNNPYRGWFIVKENKNAIGNFYVQYDNSIGINLCAEHSDKLVLSIIEFIKKTYRPVKGIPSLRSGFFYINVPFLNEDLKQVLSGIGYKKTQISFSIK